ncbi:uncharacterized protein LOC110437599 [Sorghum bicolor]|uniref:uncharacterized protein LOC110437599 n=1 Tax=Sorghum bicolor TaxID=4558 RepID=UPI000B423FE4|nr:uncharacterized protein LOC110437599 [Sorghum bicolor]|eukprot:XP_021321753.1 uncharacterized protein LOC110437599 [Sorghum bicolor]
MDVDVSKARSILPEERALEGGTRRQSPFREPNRMKVTIKMIRDACGESRDQGRLVINESQVFTVELCGMLTRIEQHERWMDYEIYDGTGSIRSRIWEVTNYNSVTEHMLSVIHEHLELGHRLSSNRIVDRMGTKAQLDIDKEGVLMLLSSDEEREKEDGLTEDYIRAKMGLDRDNMRKVLDGLINEGLVYNTVDEYHYKMAG